jgi:hypothetical protein
MPVTIFEGWGIHSWKKKLVTLQKAMLCIDLNELFRILLSASQNAFKDLNEHEAFYSFK